MHVLYWGLLLWNMAVSILLCCQIWGPKTSTEPSCDSRIFCLSLCPVAAGVFYLLETSLWHKNALLVSFFVKADAPLPQVLFFFLETRCWRLRINLKKGGGAGN